MIPETKDRLTYDAGVAMAGVVAECRRALTTIALAAGLGAGATAEEVAKRVGEMHDTLRQWWKSPPGSDHRLAALARRLAEGHKLAPQPCEDPDRCGMSMRYCGPCARRLAEEAGRG